MHPALRLLAATAAAKSRRPPVHVTLFTRSSCGLCENARNVLAGVWERRPFAYAEIDVMAPGEARWKEAYEFDVPVVHVQATTKHDARDERDLKKLMHRIEEEQVLSVMEEILPQQQQQQEEEAAAAAAGAN